MIEEKMMNAIKSGLPMLQTAIDGAYIPSWSRSLEMNSLSLAKLREEVVPKLIATYEASDTFPKYDLYKANFSDDEDFFYIVEESPYDHIQLSVKVKKTEIAGLHNVNTVSQISLWHDSSSMPVNLVSWLVCDVLVPTAKNVMSCALSDKSTHFWTTQAKAAMAQRLNVQILTMLDDDSTVVELISVTSFGQLMEYLKYALYFRLNYRLLISEGYVM